MKISGNFIYLKKIKISDALFTYNLRQIKSNSIYLHNPPKSIRDQKNWIINNIKNKTSLDFVIYNISNNRKIGAIGLKIVRNVSMHGFSLNVNNDLEMYNSFTPCGMENLNVTSLGEKTQIKYDLYKVSKEIVKNMEIELNSKINFIPKSKLI